MSSPRMTTGRTLTKRPSTATGKPPPNNLEAAILLTVTNGNYTAIVLGKNGITGTGLVKVYKQ